MDPPVVVGRHELVGTFPGMRRILRGYRLRGTGVGRAVSCASANRDVTRWVPGVYCSPGMVRWVPGI
jgi:hypothetical protein